MLKFYRGPSPDTEDVSAVPWLATFTWGVENRSASVRIPISVHYQGHGYYEDRRPTSDMDPYLATSVLVCVTLGLPFPFAVGHNFFLPLVHTFV
jgi:Glutamine synthetase, catalytic domain